MEKMVRFQTISYKLGTNYLGENPVPYIRIVNKMLAEKCGFKCGDKIAIVYQKRKLTIFTLEKYQKLTDKIISD